MSYKRIALYASYQTGENLPGYVRFALQKLAATDFHVVLLTNRRELSSETRDFLEQSGIELFLTENHGFDFGMWRRYLQAQAAGESLASLERMLLINDSIVYYRNIFPQVFERAEKSTADVFSLIRNVEYTPHLQSFFLYMKQPALGAFYAHLFETPEQEQFYDVVRLLEMGLSRKFAEAEVVMDALYSPETTAIFAYPEFVKNGSGFIKRKLLQRRFTMKEKAFFARHRALYALNVDYASLIKNASVDSDFNLDWLPRPTESVARHVVDVVWEKAVSLLLSHA